VCQLMQGFGVQGSVLWFTKLGWLGLVKGGCGTLWYTLGCDCRLKLLDGLVSWPVAVVG